MEFMIPQGVRFCFGFGINQSAGKLQMELADEVGCDLVEVSAHAGARPEHAIWQGKIYSRSGKSDKYPDFVTATGYGTGAGLCGWNCRHSFGPYIEGAPRVWTDEKLAELNEPKYEYNGEKLTEYEAQQMERHFDRQIHRWNREAEAMKAAGQDTAEARAKAAAWRARKRDFLENREEIRFIKATENDSISIKPKSGQSHSVIVSAKAPKWQEKFEDITGRWYPDATPGSHEVKDLYEYTAPDGRVFKVDGKHVSFKYSQHEKEIAELLEKEVGGELFMVPKVDYPQNVRTPDYIFHGHRYDLKTLKPGAGKNTIYNRAKKSSDQTKRVIIDITQSGLDDKIVNDQIKKIFWSKETDFIDEIVIIKDKKIIKVVRRKKKA